MKIKTILLSAIMLSTGMLSFTNKVFADTLENAIKQEGDITYIMGKEETLSNELGALLGENTSLIIKGEGYTLDGNNKKGITIQNGQTLSVTDLKVKNFKAEYKILRTACCTEDFLCVK